MSVAHSNKAVYAAIAGNVAVAAVKFTAAVLFGSSAILAEAFHSVADTGNDALLLFGRHRSNRPPDEQHPLGYGQELYFWSFIVAILVFAIGGGFSIYEGGYRILHPGTPEHSFWNYVVLALAALFEGGSLVVGYRQFRKSANGRSSWRLFRDSKDPAVFSVVLEDTAAMIGIAIAFIGIWLARHFANPVFEGAASIAIGCLLTVESLLLIRESRGLLLGEAMSKHAIDDIRQITRSCKGVSAVNRPLTLYFGPDVILLAMEVEFDSSLNAGEVIQTVDRIESSIRGPYPKIRRIYIEAEALRGKQAENK
jgi:cation diffusion facilitator family transporter